MKPEVAKFIAEWIEAIGAFAMGMLILYFTGKL